MGDRAVLLIHKRDGHVIRRWESARVAGAALGCGGSAVSHSARLRQLMFGEAIVRFEDEWDGGEAFKAGAHNLPVIVAARGRLQWFSGSQLAAQSLCMPYERMMSLLRRGTASRDGVRARYATGTDDWPRLQREARGIRRRMRK